MKNILQYLTTFSMNTMVFPSLLLHMITVPAVISTNITTTSPHFTISVAPSKNFTTNSILFPDLSFFVMGDIPYNKREELILSTQLSQIMESIDPNDSTTFLIHVGDIFKAKTCKCEIECYERTLELLTKNSTIPVFVVTGDNEWLQCPDPTLGLQRFRQFFVGAECKWDSTSILSIQRNEEKPENFSIWHSNVLFLGLNMVEVSKGRYRKNHTLPTNIEWLKIQCQKYLSKARAVIIFAHSIQDRKAYRFIRSFFDDIDIPVLYIQGNGHVWKTWQLTKNFWRIQVDQGAIAPPIKVTISEREIRIDRRGGTYDSSITNTTHFRGQ